MKGPLDAMTVSNRRWLLYIFATQVAIFVAVGVLGVIAGVILYGNRQVGNGNRVVSCATLAGVAPALHLPECADHAIGK